MWTYIIVSIGIQLYHLTTEYIIHLFTSFIHSDTFDGKLGGGTLCNQVIEYSKVDRKTVREVSTDLYNRMIKGAINFVLIGKTLDRADNKQDEKDMTEMLKDVFDKIQACDAKIKSSEWLKQWRTDLDGIIGDEPAGTHDDFKRLCSVLNFTHIRLYSFLLLLVGDIVNLLPPILKKFGLKYLFKEIHKKSHLDSRDFVMVRHRA